jgi:hypothetical protein
MQKNLSNHQAVTLAKVPLALPIPPCHVPQPFMVIPNCYVRRIPVAQFLTQHQDRLLRSSYGFLLTTLPARHKQLWSCNPIGKETAPEFGTALFLRQSGF